MPSWEVFDRQAAEYRQSVLPPEVKARLAVEAGTSRGWTDYVGQEGDVIGVDRFGESAPGEENMRTFGFTPENVADRAADLMTGRTS